MRNKKSKWWINKNESLRNEREFHLLQEIQLYKEKQTE